MKKQIRCVFEVFIRELIVCKKILMMNLIIVSLLFAVAISLWNIALSIPDELYTTMKETEYGSLQISNIAECDIQYISELPMTITGCLYGLYWFDFPMELSENQRDVVCNANGTFTDSSIAFQIYRENYQSDEINSINNNLISGSKWTKKDNEVQECNPMWIKKSLADSIGLKVGDEFTLKNESCSIELYVKGIYKDDDELYSSYVSLNLFGKMKTETENELIIFAQSKSDVSTFLKTIEGLRSKYFIVEASDAVIKSMRLFNYFLFFLSGVIMAVAISITMDFSKVLFEIRKRFWYITSFLGLSRMKIKLISGLLSEVVLLLGSMIGSVLAIYINDYFCSFIKDLFELETLNCEIRVGSILGLVLGITVIFMVLAIMRPLKQIDKIALEE